MFFRRSRSFFALVASGVFVITFAAGSVQPAVALPLLPICFSAHHPSIDASITNASVSVSDPTSRLAYHDQWRKLWEDHITWTRVVILGILAPGTGLPGTSVYTSRLLQNPIDMAAALQPYYGSTQSMTFGSLVTQHLVIAAEMLTAAKNGDTATFNTLKAAWYANAHQLAVQMNKMNPQLWPEAQTEAMWDAHLNATLAEAVDNLTGNYAGEVTSYDQVVNLALPFADFFSKGVMKQFPGKFSGPLGP